MHESLVDHSLDFSITEVNIETPESRQVLDGCDICMHCQLLRMLMKNGRNVTSRDNGDSSVRTSNDVFGQTPQSKFPKEATRNRS